MSKIHTCSRFTGKIRFSYIHLSTHRVPYITITRTDVVFHRLIWSYSGSNTSVSVRGKFNAVDE